MKTINNTPLVIAFVVVAVLFLLFGVGAMTGTMMNHGFADPYTGRLGDSFDPRDRFSKERGF